MTVLLAFFLISGLQFSQAAAVVDRMVARVHYKSKLYFLLFLQAKAEGEAEFLEMEYESGFPHAGSPKSTGKALWAKSGS